MKTIISIVKENAGIEEDNLVIPDVMQNRFGILHGEYILLLLDRLNGEKQYIPVYKDTTTALLGIYLSQISKSELKQISKFIFKNFKEITIIDCKSILHPFSFFSRNYRTNEWHISLPNSSEELWQRMSSKSKQTLRRKRNNLLKELGEDIIFEHYTSEQGIPDEIVLKYFEFKNQLMNRDYGLTAKEYIDSYHITDAYLYKSQANVYISMVFTCEQGKTVYLENLSYNPLYQKESPGFLLYSNVVEELIRKGKTDFFLGKKSQDYKQKFGSENTVCYDSIIFKNFLTYTRFIVYKLIQKIKRK